MHVKQTKRFCVDHCFHTKKLTFLLWYSFNSKLINVLQTHIRNAINNKTPEHELLYKTMKNLQYIMKFVIRSRILFAKLNDDRDQDMFEASLEGACQHMFFLWLHIYWSITHPLKILQICYSHLLNSRRVQMICFDLKVPCWNTCTLFHRIWHKSTIRLNWGKHIEMITQSTVLMMSFFSLQITARSLWKL